MGHGVILTKEAEERFDDYENSVAWTGGMRGITRSMKQLGVHMQRRGKQKSRERICTI